MRKVIGEEEVKGSRRLRMMKLRVCQEGKKINRRRIKRVTNLVKKKIERKLAYLKIQILGERGAGANI